MPLGASVVMAVCPVAHSDLAFFCLLVVGCAHAARRQQSCLLWMVSSCFFSSFFFSHRCLAHPAFALAHAACIAYAVSDSLLLTLRYLVSYKWWSVLSEFVGLAVEGTSSSGVPPPEISNNDIQSDEFPLALKKGLVWWSLRLRCLDAKRTHIPLRLLSPLVVSLRTRWASLPVKLSPNPITCPVCKCAFLAGAAPGRCSFLIPPYLVFVCLHMP